MAERCCARWYDGQPCDRPGVVLDEARGGLVCHVHAEPGPRQQEALRATIRQAMTRPDRYLAAALAEETDASLAALVGCPVSQVWRLRLMGWPRADRWDADVQLMADALGAPGARSARCSARSHAPSDRRAWARVGASTDGSRQTDPTRVGGVRMLLCVLEGGKVPLREEEAYQ
jgi:hypothetical protein